jgi:DNA-binding MarR family transcriptional regulator
MTRADRAPATTPWLLRRINQRYRDNMRAALRASGLGDLPQPGYWALSALSSGAATNASDLVELMGVSKQAVSKLVDTLVDAGYVSRRENQADRRRTNLRPTARGTAAADVIASTVESTELALAARLGVTDLGALRSVLEILAAPD